VQLSWPLGRAGACLREVVEVLWYAHVGPLGQHDLWVIVPMVVLSVIVMVLMARPKPPRPDDAHHPDRERR